MTATRTASTRHHIDAEWSEHRVASDRILLAARGLLSALQDYPAPLYADERKTLDGARVAFAEHLGGLLGDFFGDAHGAVCRRADEAGFELPALDTSDFDSAVERL